MYEFGIQLTSINATIAVVVIAGSAFVFRYRKKIKEQKQLIQERLARGLVYRDPTHKPKKEIKVFELHPDFVAKHPTWQMCSLGQYLSTLRFITDPDDEKDDEGNTIATQGSLVAQAVESQLYVVIANLLIERFGETIGAAFLPMMETGVETASSALVTKVVGYILAHVLVDADNAFWDPTEDRATMPLNVTELISMVNLNQKLRDGTVQMDEPPLVWMKRGEIGWNPSYHSPPEDEKPVLIPNPFVVEDHFEAAISGMEDMIREFQQKGGAPATYDPEDRSYPEPVPINETLLPDLYLGNGDAKVSHTKREVLRNRLFSVLLTKLSYNYERAGQCTKDHDGDASDPFFVVTMNGRDCRFPDEFVDALYDSGHTIEMCPRALITTFGLAVCVKEKDNSWTNVPLALFLRTGYESAKQRPAYFTPLHGGVDLRIEGPLVGTGNNCDIQFYMEISGLCAWNSNHNPAVPWMERNATSPVYTKEQTLEAMRMCGLLACTFNQIGTEMDLPFGGYGLVGVCNDTAALIDSAVRGTTDMYPLLSTGRFLMHTARLLMKFHGCLSAQGDTGDTVLKLTRATCAMESDIHCAPDDAIDAARRYRANFPEAYFQITADSVEVMDKLSENYRVLQQQWASTA